MTPYPGATGPSWGTDSKPRPRSPTGRIPGREDLVEVNEDSNCLAVRAAGCVEPCCCGR